MLSSPAQAGPVRLTRHSRVTFRPAGRAAITSGFWAERRRVIREVTVPSGWDRLHEAGNFRNLELAAGLGTQARLGNLRRVLDQRWRPAPHRPVDRSRYRSTGRLRQPAWVELFIIDGSTARRDFADRIRWNQAYYRLAQGF